MDSKKMNKINKKKILKISITIIIVLVLVVNFNNIIFNIGNVSVKNKNNNLTYNEYSKKMNYEYVKINNDPIIKNNEDAKNALYTFMDAGWDEYYVMCDPNYKECSSFFDNIGSGNDSLIFKLNNFVHPFNSISQIDITKIKNGIGNTKFRIRRTNRYTDQMISDTKKIVNNLYNEYYDKNNSDYENIKAFHDYILNNSVYDNDGYVNSSNAYGLLNNKTAVCGGYTDTMQLFLERLGIMNYQISGQDHVWNLVFIEGDWKHLDLTWDDYKLDTVYYGFFLINNEELEKQTYEEHDYDRNIFIEAK